MEQKQGQLVNGLKQPDPHAWMYSLLYLLGLVAMFAWAVKGGK